MSTAAVVPAQELLDQLDGARIATCYVEDDRGLHICLADGRILIIAGQFAVSVLMSEKLH
jgi:hypothetical protein